MRCLVPHFPWDEQQGSEASDICSRCGSRKDAHPVGLNLQELPELPERLERLVDRFSDEARRMERIYQSAHWVNARDDLLAELRRYVAVLDKMRKHWSCERFAPHAFGEEPKFVGCKLYRSDDPNEYCLGCEAEAALSAGGRRGAP